MGLELGNSNAIKWNSNTQRYEHFQKPIRELIVNNSERFRLEVNRELIYAKGKINFDFNLEYKDSNGIVHEIFSHDGNVWYDPARWFPKYVFAYYKDGFYSYNNNKYRKHSEDSLLNKIFANRYVENFRDTIDVGGGIKIQFLGWFLSPLKENKNRISSIDDVYKKTKLFNFKKDNELSEITLYAHWGIPEYTVTLYNITRNRNSGYSFFDYQGQTYSGREHPKSFKIIYNTDMRKYLEDNVTNIFYRTFGYTALDGTSYQQSLRNNPQKFLGWSLSSVYADYPRKLPISADPVFSGWELPIQLLDKEKDHRINLYPQFTPIVILKYGKLPKGTVYYGNTTPQHPTGRYYVQGVGGHYYLLFTDSENTNSHLYELDNFRSYADYLSYTYEREENASWCYYYEYDMLTYDEYRWKLVEKDNNIIFDSDNNFTPLSSTFVYTIEKYRTRKRY